MSTAIRDRRSRAFETWVHDYGIDRLAKTLGVNPMTVVYWLTLRCDPRAEPMRKIKRLSRGKVSYADMIDRPTPYNSFMKKRRQALLRQVAR